MCKYSASITAQRSSASQRINLIELGLMKQTFRVPTTIFVIERLFEHPEI